MIRMAIVTSFKARRLSDERITTKLDKHKSVGSKLEERAVTASSKDRLEAKN